MKTLLLRKSSRFFGIHRNGRPPIGTKPTAKRRFSSLPLHPVKKQSQIIQAAAPKGASRLTLSSRAIVITGVISGFRQTGRKPWPANPWPANRSAGEHQSRSTLTGFGATALARFASEGWWR
jgi:hypothetical protein